MTCYAQKQVGIVTELAINIYCCSFTRFIYFRFSQPSQYKTFKSTLIQLKLHRNKNNAVSSNFGSNLKKPAQTKLGRLALNWRQSLKIYVVLLLSCKHSNYIHYVVKFFLKNHFYFYFKCLSVDVVFGTLFTILYIALQMMALLKGPKNLRAAQAGPGAQTKMSALN